MPPHTHMVAPPNAVAYPVLVERGALQRLPQFLPDSVGNLAVIADERVQGLHGKVVTAALSNAGVPLSVHTFPSGEASKTRETKARLEDELLGAGLGRDGVIVALGGGVATDLAGFVAATYLRGVPYIAVPTTLLAMVDASVGGKTGVNHGLGKNLIGAFHQPLAVVADTDTLETLPAEEHACGLAEMAKHALIAGDDAVGALLAEVDALRELRSPQAEELIAASVKIKAGIVEQDPGERDIRAVLNLGHTVGHALERASGYAVSHGRAVAIGLVAEALVAERVGVSNPAQTRHIRELLEQLGLPVSLPGSLSPEAVVAATDTDKKGRGRFSLLTAVGEPARRDGCWTHFVPEAELLKALELTR